MKTRKKYSTTYSYVYSLSAQEGYQDMRPMFNRSKELDLASETSGLHIATGQVDAPTLGSWLDDIMKGIRKRVKVKTETQAGAISFEIRKERSPMEALNSSSASHSLPGRTEKLCLILFIDEANRLRTLFCDCEYGLKALA